LPTRRELYCCPKCPARTDCAESETKKPIKLRKIDEKILPYTRKVRSNFSALFLNTISKQYGRYSTNILLLYETLPESPLKEKIC
jgi:hypothetical protein